MLSKGPTSAEADSNEPKAEESATAEEKKDPIVPILKTQDLSSEVTNRKASERNVTFDEDKVDSANVPEAEAQIAEADNSDLASKAVAAAMSGGRNKKKKKNAAKEKQN